MPLTDLAVRNAKPADKPYKLTDGGGMYLFVQPNGGKYWRFAYRYLDRQKVLALGVYPQVGLAVARQRRMDAREKLASGNSFQLVALAWMDERKTYVEIGQYEKTLARFEKDVFPWLGRRPVTDIATPEILAVLKRIDSRGVRFTAHRVRSEINRVFRYAIKEDFPRSQLPWGNPW